MSTVFSRIEADVPTGQKERRKARRDGPSDSVYVHSVDASGRRFEEVRTMNNSSRTGFYFITHRQSYRRGMQLYVIPAFGGVNFEYEGEVVRVKTLPFGEFGVAVRLKRMGNLVLDSQTAARSAFQAFAQAENASSLEHNSRS